MMKVTPARQALRIPVMGAENKKKVHCGVIQNTRRLVVVHIRYGHDGSQGKTSFTDSSCCLGARLAGVQGLLGCSAAPTRREYFPVGSRFSSLKTNSCSDVSAGALGRLRYDRLMSGMTSTSPHVRVHGVS